LRRIRGRLSVWIEGCFAGYEPVAEVGPLFVFDILSSILPALSRHNRIEVTAHFADMQVGAALWARVAP